MRISQAHRRVVSASAMIAASLLTSRGLLAQAQPSITLDLRVDGTGGKNAVVENVGDQVVLDLYAMPHGLDGNDSNDGVDVITCGFQSSTGGLKGNLLGLEPPPPFDGSGWSTGDQNDLDGDGDLDIGVPADQFSYANQWYGLREPPQASYSQPVGGYFVGQIFFTVTSLAGDETIINPIRRPSDEAILIQIDKPTGVYVKQSNVFLTPGITITRDSAGGGGPVQYIDGTYDTHLSIADNEAVTPGKTLTISRGLDLGAGGALDTTTGAGAIFNINELTSANNGGSLLGLDMSIATTADGLFTQADGYSRFQSVAVGVTAGHTGTLSITGGTMDSGPITVGGAGIGSFHQSGGSATVASIDLADGSTARIEGGKLQLAGNVSVGDGGDATLTIAGGDTAINRDLKLGPATGEHGTLAISDGSLSVNRTFAGSLDENGPDFGTGEIQQTGGTFNPGQLNVSSVSSDASSVYQLTGGQVRASSIAVDGGGQINQSGGGVDVNGVLGVDRDRVGFTQSAQYFISNGTLNAEQGIVVNRTNASPTPASGHVGGFVQTGGTVTTRDMHVSFDGTYEALGGTLNVNGNLLLDGKLDFGGSTTTANFGTNSFADFSPGQLVGTQNATFTGGPGSLMNFAPGFDPYAQIGHITTQGLIHINGQPLTIPSDKSVGGSGTIVGNVTNNGALTPGNSPGEIDITGDYLQAAGANLGMQIAGTASDDFDLLTVTGNAQLDGTLSVSLLNGFVPSADDRFTILTAGDLTGTFTNAPQFVDLAGGRFDVIYSPTSVTLADFQAVPEPASLAMLSMGTVVLLRRRRRRNGEC